MSTALEIVEHVLELPSRSLCSRYRWLHPHREGESGPANVEAV